MPWDGGIEADLRHYFLMDLKYMLHASSTLLHSPAVDQYGNNWLGDISQAINTNRNSKKRKEADI